MDKLITTTTASYIESIVQNKFYLEFNELSFSGTKEPKIGYKKYRSMDEGSRTTNKITTVSP